ncbi:MAG: hypothetical protein AAF465_15720 [Pseudomonadota bacterium]
MTSKARTIARRWLPLVALAGVGTAGEVLAVDHEQPSLKEQLALCAERVPDAARLACYDGLAEQMTASTPLTPSVDSVEAPAAADTATVDVSTGVPVATAQPAATATGSAEKKTENVETFGRNENQKQSIRVMLEKTKRNARGDWYFYFDNGEVWKQIDSSRRRIPALPVAATISRGIFSSYKLHIDGERWAMKVRRLK